MSYILYSSIARAGGIDLYLESGGVSHARAQRHRRRPRGPGRLALWRRATGRGLIALGRIITRWGCRWAPGTSDATPAPAG